MILQEFDKYYFPTYFPTNYISGIKKNTIHLLMKKFNFI